MLCHRPAGRVRKTPCHQGGPLNDEAAPGWIESLQDRLDRLAFAKVKVDIGVDFDPSLWTWTPRTAFDIDSNTASQFAHHDACSSTLISGCSSIHLWPFFSICSRSATLYRRTGCGSMSLCCIQSRRLRDGEVQRHSVRQFSKQSLVRGDPEVVA